MTVTYHAGNRIQGTNLDRVGGTTDTIPSGGVGGWKELGRTTLGSNGDTISVQSLSDKRYYMWLVDTKATGGNVELKTRANNDSANNYSFRYSSNGGSDAGQTGYPHSGLGYYDALGSGESGFTVGYTANLSSKEKLTIGNHVSNKSGTGAATAPDSVQTVAKWANTSNALNRIDYYNDDAGDFASGSEVVVLEYDPDDTHTDNFWEELSSVTTTSSGTSSSGTITAKKYLMYQIIGKKASGSGTGSPRFQFNSDTGSNYAQRNGINGTHYTYGNQSSANIGGDGNTAGEMAMFTGFIINNASTEKLFLGFSAFGNTAGAGQIGNRGEIFDKWANTSNQITSINCMNLNFDAGAKMTIWGSD